MKQGTCFQLRSAQSKPNAASCPISTISLHILYSVTLVFAQPKKPIKEPPHLPCPCRKLGDITIYRCSLWAGKGWVLAKAYIVNNDRPHKQGAVVAAECIMSITGGQFTRHRFFLISVLTCHAKHTYFKICELTTGLP